MAFAAPGPAHAKDGAIIIVSGRPGQVPAAEMELRIRRALEATSTRYSQTDLDFLVERAARGLTGTGPAELRICVPAGSPCVTLVRE